MKKHDWLLAGAVLVIACLASVFLYGGRERGSCVLVQVDGTEYGTYDLYTDQVIEIGTSNRLEIRDGEAFMAYAECPDQLCVHMAPISQVHELIVCMPNRVAVEVVERRNGRTITSRSGRLIQAGICGMTNRCTEKHLRTI